MASDSTDPTCSDSSAAPCTCDGFTTPDPTTSGLPDSASYSDNGDGTVTDNVTGLLWETRPSPTGEQCPTRASGTDTFSAFTCNQAEAAAYCASRGINWRLPTMRELVSLLDWTTYSPSSSLSPAMIKLASFPGTPATAFWTSTLDASEPGQAWRVDFAYGSTEGTPVTWSLRVRCVSPGAAARCYAKRYQIRTAGEISDAATGLTWRQTTEALGWNDATTYCPEGWRLPSLIELQTIVDDRTRCPAIDSIFAGTPTTLFWTSSSSPRGHWYVNFANGGIVGPSNSDQKRQVRCVR